MRENQTYMVELREVVCLLLHATSPMAALGAKLADDIDKIDDLDDDLLSRRNVIRQADLALATGSKNDVGYLELVLELLHNKPVSHKFGS